MDRREVVANELQYVVVDGHDMQYRECYKVADRILAALDALEGWVPMSENPKAIGVY